VLFPAWCSTFRHTTTLAVARITRMMIAGSGRRRR
jgi:hypothetical protein